VKSPRIDSIISEAETLREQARYRQAIRLFRKALLGCKKSRDKEGIYYCVRSLGDVYRMTGCFQDAATMYTEAIKLAKGIHSPEKAADARIGLALSLRAQGYWKKALQRIRTSKNLYLNNKDRHGVAFALWAEAGTLRIKGDILGALKKFSESYRLFRALKNDQGIGYCLCGLGGASRVAGRIKASMKYYVAANRLFSNIHDTFGKAYSFCGIANAYRMLGDYQNAFPSFAKATRLYRTIGDKVSYAYTLWGLGTAYKMVGRHQQARTHMKAAMQFFRETEDPRGIIYCHLGFGEIAFLTGDVPRAEKHLQSAREALAIFRFGAEECHTETLHAIMSRLRPDIFQSAQKDSGRATGKHFLKESCYHRLGLNLQFHSLPLNIP
jgi:tetratricopeptide (TPR) repeat protein